MHHSEASVDMINSVIHPYTHRHANINVLLQSIFFF
jgi:hypothetical protein